MRPIAPRIEGADEFDIAEGQHEFVQLVGAIVKAHAPGALEMGDNLRDTLVFRYTLSAEERVRIANGEDIYLAFLARQGTPPHHLRVGFP